MHPSTAKIGRALILYDAERVGEAPGELFEPDVLAARGALSGHASGRGLTHLFRHAGEEYVLRHYRRGGMIATLLGDRYLWTGLYRTRAWREWHLLAHLAGLSLPVPRPLAARVVRTGAWYRADLITQRIADAYSLAQTLERGALDAAQWMAIGSCIRALHDARVSHADLNAHNILIGGDGAVHLIDFDRGAVRGGWGWRRRNLERLQRSLRKLGAERAPFHFDGADWDRLREGYGPASD